MFWTGLIVGLISGAAGYYFAQRAILSMLS